MSDAAPPPWVKRLRKRENGVDAGVKVLLITCWGYGPYKRTGPEEPRDGANPIGAAPERQPAKPVTLWACVETLAEESGQPEGTVKDQLRRALALGYIRRDKGSRMTLAWRAPGVFEYGTRTAGRPDRTVDQPDGGPTCPDGSPTDADGGPAAARTVGRPQTSNELPIELPMNVGEARDRHDLDQYGIAAATADERSAVYGPRYEHDPAPPPPPKPRPGRQLVTGKPSSSTSDWRKNRARAQLEAQRERESAVITGEMPSGSKLPIAVHKAIEAHDNGAWSVSVASQTWADACADTMDADNLDLAHVLRLLDAWTAEARPTRQPGQPSKREIWYTWGDRGKRARAWVERTMESTRAALRVVSDVDTYELELAEMRR